MLSSSRAVSNDSFSSMIMSISGCERGWSPCFSSRGMISELGILKRLEKRTHRLLEETRLLLYFGEISAVHFMTSLLGVLIPVAADISSWMLLIENPNFLALRAKFLRSALSRPSSVILENQREVNGLIVVLRDGYNFDLAWYIREFQGISWVEGFLESGGWRKEGDPCLVRWSFLSRVGNKWEG